MEETRNLEKFTDDFIKERKDLSPPNNEDILLLTVTAKGEEYIFPISITSRHTKTAKSLQRKRNLHRAQIMTCR